jgi:hypothetical protein
MVLTLSFLECDEESLLSIQVYRRAETLGVENRAIHNGWSKTVGSESGMQRAFEMAAQRSQIVFGAAPAGDIICKASRTSKALQRLYISTRRKILISHSKRDRRR